MHAMVDLRRKDCTILCFIIFAVTVAVVWVIILGFTGCGFRRREWLWQLMALLCVVALPVIAALVGLNVALGECLATAWVPLLRHTSGVFYLPFLSSAVC